MLRVAQTCRNRQSIVSAGKYALPRFGNKHAFVLAVQALVLAAPRRFPRCILLRHPAGLMQIR